MGFAVGVERVDVDALSSLICAGWLPQDRTFESRLTAGLEIEHDLLQGNVIAHRTDAGHSETLAEHWVNPSLHHIKSQMEH
jgi:hypothetical protein